MKDLGKSILIGLLAVLLSVLALLSMMILEGDRSFLVYIALLVTGSFVVGMLSHKLGLRARDLALVSIWAVPLLVISGASAVHLAARLLSSSQGITEGDGLVAFSLFVLVPSVLMGLFGSLFNAGLSKNGS